MTRFGLALMLTLLALLAGACSGGKELNAGAEVQRETPSVNTPAPLAGLQLPAPSALPRITSAPPQDTERFTQGGYTLTGFPENNVLAVNSGDSGAFSPSYSQPANATLDHAAFGTYYLTNMAEYTGPAQIMHEWITPPADWGNAYMAVANFTRNRWDWFKLSADPVQLSGWSKYIDPQGRVFVLVMLLGTDSAELDWLIAGDSVFSGFDVYGDLNQDPALNLAPLTVNFTASLGLYGSSINTYSWDFDGDGTEDLSTSGPGPEAHLYNDPGTYTCKVTATAADGKVFNAEKTITAVDPLNQAPVAAIDADVMQGDAPLAVSLDASASTDDDSIVKYEWDIDGDGEYEFDTGAVPSLDYTFVRNGSTSVTVRVTDNDFASDTAQLGISLDSGWRTVVVDNDVQVSALALAVNGSSFSSRAMVAYVDNTDQDLFFARAGSDLGTGWTAPIEPINNSVYVISRPAMTVNPATDEAQIAYLQLTETLAHELHYVTATLPDGSNWDFEVTVSADDDFASAFAVAPGAGGKPGILAKYGNSFGSQTLRYYLASDVDGHTWGAPAVLGNLGFDQHVSAVDLLNTGTIPLSAVSGLFEAGGGGFGFSAAATADGQSWDPLDSVVFGAGYDSSLAMVAGRPAVAAGTYGQGTSIYYLRADDAEGRDWSGTVQELVPAGSGGKASMAVVNSKPAIAYYNFDTAALMYLSASDADGTSWDAAYAVDSVTFSGEQNLELVNSNNFPVICYPDVASKRLLAAGWY